MSLTLDGNINASTENIAVSGTIPAAAVPGFLFALDNEVIRLVRFRRPGSSQPYPDDDHAWQVQRGVSGSTAASHTSGATLYAVREALTKGEDVATVPSPFPVAGTELSEDIQAALAAADSPSAGNPFVTEDAVPTPTLLAVLGVGADTGGNPLEAKDGEIVRASMSVTPSGVFDVSLKSELGVQIFELAFSIAEGLLVSVGDGAGSFQILPDGSLSYGGPDATFSMNAAGAIAFTGDSLTFNGSDVVVV